jgi:hypothetical protein
MAEFKMDNTAKLWPEPFEENGIRLLAEAKNPNQRPGGTWAPSVPGKDHIQYPPDDFAKQIHEKLEAVGDALVMTDKPGKNCYLVVLQKREPPEPSDVGKYLTETMPGSLKQYMEQERLSKYRSQILHQLRKDAGLETDDREVDDDGNARLDDRGRPMLDEFGNPAYKKTYTVTDDLTKKVQSDMTRE